MGPRLRYTLKRLLFVPIGLFIVVTVSFGLVNLTPGDPARVIAGGLATEADIADIRTELGLDRPLAERYVDYATGVFRGDLGQSFYTKRPITHELRQRFGDTIELVFMSLAVAVILGLTLGGVGAYYRGRVPDRLTRTSVSVVQSVPDFLWGLLLIYCFFYLLQWAPPPVGRLGIMDSRPPARTGGLIMDAVLDGDLALARSALGYSVLPVVSLGLFYSAFFAKTARAVLGVAFGSEQVEFARACGLREKTVIRYALREALAPILTYGAILLAVLVGGAAIIETVFSWGGIGQWAIGAVLNLDVPAIQGFILLTGLVTLVVYVLLDVLVAILDPRISYG